MRSTSSAIQFVNNSTLICKSSQNMNAKMVFASKKNAGTWRASAWLCLFLKLFFHLVDRLFSKPCVFDDRGNRQSVCNHFSGHFLSFAQNGGVHHIDKVTVVLEALLIAAALLRGVLHDFRLFEKLCEDPFLQGGRAFQQPREVLQGEHPLVEHRLQLVLILAELRHFKIDESQLVVEHMLVGHVKKFDFVAETIFLKPKSVYGLM